MTPKPSIIDTADGEMYMPMGIKWETTAVPSYQYKNRYVYYYTRRIVFMCKKPGVMYWKEYRDINLN